MQHTLTILLLSALVITGGGCAQGDRMPEAVMTAFNEANPGFSFNQPPEVASREPLVIRHGERSGNQVALTFDACSPRAGTDRDPRIPELLRASGTPATLFLGGLWMAKYPEFTRALHEEPLFELGNHAWSHPDLTEMDREDVVLQLGMTQLMALALTGEQPRWFRAPYARYDSAVAKEAARLGLVTVQYDLSSGDADTSLSPEAITDQVLERSKPGSIIVLHMNNPELPTAEALPGILEGLEKKGLEPVTLGELKGR